MALYKNLFTDVEKVWLNKVTDVIGAATQITNVYQQFGMSDSVILSVMINRLREKIKILKAHKAKENCK